MSREPRLLVFALTEYFKKGDREPRTKWTLIGSAFRNTKANDGSINIELNALPVGGRMQIREETDEERRRREDRENDNRRGGGDRDRR